MSNLPIAIALWALASPAAAQNRLEGKSWIRGSADCATNRDPPIDVFEHDPDTYIVRQNKCMNFEASFIYVLFRGAHRLRSRHWCHCRHP